jgi:hypothetical protein
MKHETQYETWNMEVEHEIGLWRIKWKHKHETWKHETWNMSMCLMLLYYDTWNMKNETWKHENMAMETWNINYEKRWTYEA